MGRNRKIWTYRADLQKVPAHIVRVFDDVGFSAQVVVFARDRKLAMYFAPIGYPYASRYKFEYVGIVHHVKISPEYGHYPI